MHSEVNLLDPPAFKIEARWDNLQTYVVRNGTTANAPFKIYVPSWLKHIAVNSDESCAFKGEAQHIHL